MKWIRIILASAVGLWLADYFVSGFSAPSVLPDQLLDLAIAGLILGLLIIIAGTILKIVTAPLVFLTAGLFKLVIYGALIWVLAQFTQYASVSGLIPLALSTLIISAVVYIAKGFKL